LFYKLIEDFSKILPFNKPFIAGREIEYIKEAVASGKISGGGAFSSRSENLIRDSFSLGKVLLTTSCTDALEMAALLLDIQPGDEVILPSFNFVSAANAFALRGAHIHFADIDPQTLNIAPAEIERLISARTRAVSIVHYAGVACEMERISEIADSTKSAIVEDAALAFDSYYIFRDGTRKALGGIGRFGAFSFHETKNIIAGEGGAIVLNNEGDIEKAEIVREKGTDRAKLFRGEVDKYTWKELGSSFLPSELTAAFLFGQLELYRNIQNKRVALWNRYRDCLSDLEKEGCFKLPFIPSYATINASVFYLICRNEKERNGLIGFLLERRIKAVFHYLPLHLSPYYLKNSKIYKLPVTEDICARIIRLPLFYELSNEQVDYIADSVRQFFKRI
jgi:dTDP-4-amino-4,6-dideoxygalactose transaminase